MKLHEPANLKNSVPHRISSGTYLSAKCKQQRFKRGERTKMKINMLRPFAIRAGWFRPGSDDQRLAGTLRYRPDRGLRLTVHAVGMDVFGVRANEPIVHRLCGESINGEFLSACDGFLTRTEKGAGGVTKTEFLFHRLFIGEELVDDVASRFMEMDVSFNQLIECIGARVGTAETNESDVTLKAFRPPSITFLKDAEKHVLSSYRRSFRTHYLGGNMRVQTEPTFRTEFEKPTSLDVILETLRRLQHFVAFLRNCRVLPIRAAVKLHRPNGSADESEGWCDLCFVPIGAQLGPTSPSPFGPNLSFANLETELHEPTEQMLGRWFDTFTRNSLMMSLYFSERYGEANVVENRFLNLTQALETFHRLNFKNEQLPSEEHGQRLQSILSSCPDQHRKWLGEKLQYSNEPSLRQRLRELLNMYHAYAMGIIPLQKPFIEQVVGMRNTLAHGLKADTDSLVLYFLNACLSALIEAILFKEIGLSDQTTLRIVQGRWTAEAQRWLAELTRSRAGN